MLGCTIVVFIVNSVKMNSILLFSIVTQYHVKVKSHVHLSFDNVLTRTEELLPTLIQPWLSMSCTLWRFYRVSSSPFQVCT